MAQLSESVKAIYGANFDGYSYLKRFFNVEYALPSCKNHGYMWLLLGEYPELGSYDLELGLPMQDFVEGSEDYGSFHDDVRNSTDIKDIKKTIRIA